MKIAFSFVLCGLFPLPGFAQSVATAPVGANTVSALANADTVLPIPLARTAAGSGKVVAVSGASLTVVSPNPWGADHFVNQAHYVRFKTGHAAGRFYTVTANTVDRLTVDWNGEAPAVAGGDEFLVIPYWTLATLLPASEAGRAFMPSGAVSDMGTIVYLRDPAHPQAAPPTTFLFRAGAWRKFGDQTNADHGSTAVPPDAVLTMRNHGAATKIVTTGDVQTVPASVVINAPGGADRLDNELTLAALDPVALAESNLVASGAFEPSPAAGSRRDELRVYASRGHVSALVATYYFSGGAWRKVGASIDATFDQARIFTPNTRVVLNKAGTGTEPKTVYWTQPTLAIN